MGSSIDVLIQAKELNRTLKVVHQFYQQFTGLPLETIQEETDRDNFMSPARAKELGIIDDVIEPPAGIPTRQPALAA
jgi:ATP-dependent Clp protease protease subunit